MNFIDLAAQQARIKPRLDAAIQGVLAHGRYVMGPEVAELERRLADYVGVPHCIGCANGTDALQIALMALDIGAGDEVIVPGFTFIASAESVVLAGARPVFVDIDPYTYLIDPEAVEAAITPRTRAIMPVSMFGQCADMEAIGALARQHGLAVVEDAAQSFGATRHGRRSCGLSHIACTSFFPSKPLGAYGDGGAVFTDDGELAEKVRLVARHGEARRYHHTRVGMNSRLDTLQAAILLAKLELFDEEVTLRQQVAERYAALLAETGVVRALPGARQHQRACAVQHSRTATRRRSGEACRQRDPHGGALSATAQPSARRGRPRLQPTGHRDGMSGDSQSSDAPLPRGGAAAAGGGGAGESAGLKRWCR